MRGSCRGATEGASAVKAELAPSGPLGHLPRIAGEDLYRSANAPLSAKALNHRYDAFGVLTPV